MSTSSVDFKHENGTDKRILSNGITASVDVVRGSILNGKMSSKSDEATALAEDTVEAAHQCEYLNLCTAETSLSLPV